MIKRMTVFYIFIIVLMLSVSCSKEVLSINSTYDTSGIIAEDTQADKGSK